MTTFRKSVVAILIFVVMVSLMTVQKTTLFTSIRSVLHQDVSIETGYAILTLVLLPPYVFSVFLTLWNVPFILKSSSTKFPRLSNVCLGILASLVESGCVVIFVTRVFSALPLFVSVLAMQGILGVSCLLTFIKSGMGSSTSIEDMSDKSDGKPEPRKEGGVICCNGARIAMSAMCVLAFPAVALFLFGMGLTTIVTSFSLAVIPCLLGLVWTKELQEYISNPSETNSLCDKRFTVFYGIVKVIGVAAFISLELYLRSSISHQRELIPLFLSGFKTVFECGHVIYPLIILHASNLLCLATTHISLSLCLPLFGFVLPSMFSTAASVILCVALGQDLYNVDETEFFGSFSQHCICAVILTWSWVWPYVSNTSIFVRKPQYLLTPYKWLFLGYEWNPVFGDQRFLLGYDTGRSSKLMKESRNAKNRIYICTTMYREADYEMERLLISLEEMSKDDCLKHTHLESNIFMDNGCNGDSLNDFARQLVSLLITKIGVDFETSHCCRTPYGIQLFCKLPSGLPMFIHFKDPKKVKAKKRWSQTMYINYVMRFRKSRWRHDKDNNKNLDVTDNEVSDIKLQEIDSSFILRAISNIDGPKLTDFKSYKAESDQGFSSVDESTPPFSESSIQMQASSSSKDSSDVDSLTLSEDKEMSLSGLSNNGYQRDPTDVTDSRNSKPDEDKFTINSRTIPTINVTGGCSIAKSDDKLTQQLDKRPAVSIDQHAYVDDDHTYILATDADMDFKGKAVKELLDLCNADKSIGAACGRTHPIGKNRSAVVWHQVFEYAKDFWMIKNAQNIIGSVSCCPGCFSLYRASAIRDVMGKYASPTRSPFSVYVKDTGEDRWMATLMMINGWKMRYSPFADNSTYCPDTFQEYYKQRKRWILSDMANAVLAMRHLVTLTRNNACFSAVYVIYLVNMFVNNIITPGTAIVMITAGLELVFSVPYIYTTVPLTLTVYLYAGMCTCLSVRNQGILTSLLTGIMGSLFAAVAIFGTYKISAEMAHQIDAGNFHFQQHYVILLLALSLVYAGLMHPSEIHQFIYGLAYLFIFPAMHILLPIYSIANIIDQSWGTRDSNTAKISCGSCCPSFKLFKKKNKKQEDNDEPQDDVISTLTANLNDMAEGDRESKEESAFWDSLVSTSLGVDVNLGMKKEDLAEGLRIFRNRCLLGFMMTNAVWLSFLSYFYMGLDSPLSKLNIYGVISGALYGFTLVIQIVGLTGGRLEQGIRRVARFVYGDDALYWVNERSDVKQRKSI